MQLGNKGKRVVTEDVPIKIGVGIYRATYPIIPGTIKITIRGIRRKFSDGDYIIANDLVTVTFSADVTATIADDDEIVFDYEC
jgi:hypothetical protein